MMGEQNPLEVHFNSVSNRKVKAVVLSYNFPIKLPNLSLLPNNISFKIEITLEHSNARFISLHMSCKPSSSELFLHVSSINPTSLGIRSFEVTSSFTLSSSTFSPSQILSFCSPESEHLKYFS